MIELQGGEGPSHELSHVGRRGEGGNIWSLEKVPKLREGEPFSLKEKKRRRLVSRGASTGKGGVGAPRRGGGPKKEKGPNPSSSPMTAEKRGRGKGKKEPYPKKGPPRKGEGGLLVLSLLAPKKKGGTQGGGGGESPGRRKIMMAVLGRGDRSNFPLARGGEPAGTGSSPS